MTDNNTDNKPGNMGKAKNIVLALLVLSTAIRGHAQVNLQTGSAVFSLPIFNWQDDKSRLNTVVALGYNSGNGLKVNDVASNVGQGWNMVAGGAITRMQVGEPDDQKAYLGTTPEKVDDLDKYPAGYLYTSVPATKGCPNALTSYPIFNAQNQLYHQHNIVAADRELDYFYFQFNGRSGTFVLNKALGDVGVMLGDSKLKITFTRDEGMTAPDGKKVRTTINSFTITDENGLSYTFSQLGLTKVLSNRYCDGSFRYPMAQPNFDEGQVYYQTNFDDGKVANPWVVNNWCLTKVTDLLTNRYVTFTYVTRDISSSGGYSFSHNQGKKDYSTITRIVSVNRSPELALITCPDGHKVAFNPGAARVDVAGAYALGSVDVLYTDRQNNGAGSFNTSTRYVSRFQLNTSYFIKNRYGNPVSDYQKRVARLCLQSVKRYGVDLKDEDRPYLFDYYMGSGSADDFVPPACFYAKDIWGFYNGDQTRAGNGSTIPLDMQVSDLSDAQIKGLCFMNDNDGSNYASVVINPKSGYARNGLLKQVVYPTGGALGYSYDQNSGLLNGQLSAVGGVHVSQTSSTDGSSPGASGANGCANPIVSNYSYVDESSQSSLWGIEQPINSMKLLSHFERVGRHYRFPLSWRWDYQYPGIMEREQAVPDPGFFLTAIPYITEAVTVYGLYKDIALLLSSNPTPAAIIGAIIDIIVDVVSFILDGSKHANDYTNVNYFDHDMNGANPLPMQFRRVVVTQSTGGNGKTVAEFTSKDDYPLWVAEGANTNYSMKQRFAPWAYGLPKKTTVFDVDGYPVKQTENIYSFDRMCRTFDAFNSGPLANDIAFAHGPSAPSMERASTDSVACGPTKTALDDISCKCFVTKSSSQPGSDWDNAAIYNPTPDPSNPAANGYTKDGQANPNPDLTASAYDLYSGRTELDRSYERAFNPKSASQYLETYSAYMYNSGNYQPSQVISKLSNGDITQKNITYSIDNPTAVPSAMLQNNMVNEPVTVSAMVAKVGQGYSNTLGSTRTQYTQLASGAIKPSGTLEDRYAAPGAASTTVQTQTFMYDANSNLTGMKDEGNHVITNIYGYNDKYIIASVINADPVTDRSAYSSFEDGGLGGWTAAQAPLFGSGGGVTGNNTLDLSSAGSLSAPLNTGKPYRLSFWASGTVNISGGTSISKSAPLISGYTYYEYDIARGTASVSLSGNGQLDELRLYPADARMRTVTYDPLVGKTSECDENNRVTYYEYDGLSRLRFVKDENRNVVKMYEYNYKQQQNGCPGTYYSRAVSEIFTRGNCGGGYLGGNVTYTIPAAKYTSNINQADADRQVEDELAASGQAYADAGGSCRLLYYNAAQTQNFTRDCGVGYVGNQVAYTVPAGRYSSIVSQAEADGKASADMLANGQAYANNGAGSCSQDPNPDWEGDDSSPTRCADGSTATPLGHKEMLMTDVNPFTNQGQQWKDIGADASCQTTPPCSIGFNYPAGFSYSTSSIGNNGSSVSCGLVFGNNSTWYPGDTYTVATIGGSCRPSAIRYATSYSMGKAFNIVIYPSGAVSVQLAYGSGQLSPSFIALSFSYNP